MSCYANSYRHLVPSGSNPDTRSLPQRMDRRESSTSIRSAKYRSRRSNPSPPPPAPPSAPTRPTPPRSQAPHHAPRRSNFAYIASISSS
jgi:hypothetical protein